MSDPLVTKVIETIHRHRLLKSGSRVLVAVSGGPDSVALLHVLQALRRSWRLEVRAAHLDHALRAESADDAAFVRGLGQRWGVPMTIIRHDVAARCARQGWSLEDGARRVRYQVLLELARDQRADRVCLAHTADDQAETVLMRLIRGTGLLGLGAIPIERSGDGVSYVRPLLEVWRADILDYLRRHRLSFREDPSNTDRRFFRNRIRHELLPLLARDYNPNIRQALVQLAQQSRSDYDYLQEAAARVWKRLAKSRPQGRVAIAIDAFRQQPKALQQQLVRQAIARVRGSAGRLEFRHWLEVERIFLDRPVGTLVDLPGGIQFRREPTAVICQRLDGDGQTQYTQRRMSDATCATVDP